MHDSRSKGLDLCCQVEVKELCLTFLALHKINIRQEDLLNMWCYFEVSFSLRVFKWSN